MTEKISFTLNDKPVVLEVDGNRKLLWVLRTELGLTGTKYGCGEGLCGACTVIVNDEPALACQTDIKTLKGAKVLTIEGLEKGGKLHPLQKAFIRHDALQCGFCTPGMIMKSYGLLSRNHNPTRQDISKSLEDNLCRCGAHTRIVDAVLTAAEELKGGRKL
jgi:aerobic-type carbon monoxide dehydrogenase small subunit (CoxS/CutS family)